MYEQATSHLTQKQKQRLETQAFKTYFHFSFFFEIPWNQFKKLPNS